MHEVPLVVCSGAARERGRAYGEQARELILVNVETYREMFMARYQATWEDVGRQVEPVTAVVAAFDGDLLEELRGIAEGAGVPLIDILVLNARSSVTMTRPNDGCTTIASVPADDDPAPTILGQNWDNVGRLRPVVVRVEEPGKPTILTFTEAGTLAKIGLNDAGIGLCVNGLCVTAPGDRGVPIFVMLRKVLQKSSLGGAMEVITKAHRDAPHNYMLASSEGGAFTIEALVGDFDILMPEGCYLVHTNHLLSPRLLVRDELKASHPDTVTRLWRARRLLARRAGLRSCEELVEVLGDHFDAPHAICRHAVPGGDPFAMQTNNAVTMDLTVGRMHVTRGTPCQGDTVDFVI